MKITSQHGFSLVQVLMAVALLSLVAVMGAQMMAGLSKNMRSMDSKNLTISANQTLQVYLANESICTQAMSPVKIQSLEKMEMAFNVPGAGVFAKGQRNNTMDLETTELSVDNLVQAETSPLGSKVYIGTLKMSFERSNGATKQTFKAVPLGALSLMADSTGKVLKCAFGKVSIQQIDQNNMISAGAAAYPAGQPAASGSSKTCATAEQCLVYDHYLRNGIPNAIATADEWMKTQSDWQSKALAYLNSMTNVGKMNLLAAAKQAGLIQAESMKVTADDVKAALANNPDLMMNSGLDPEAMAEVLKAFTEATKAQ